MIRILQSLGKIDDREERVPHLQPIPIPRLWLCGLLCALASGCAAPRTFVAETKEKTSSRPQQASAPADFTPPMRSVAPASAPNHPEPSVWSKWVGALVPSKPKPAKRIPLPRTDRKSEPAGAVPGEPEPPDFSGFY